MVSDADVSPGDRGPGTERGADEHIGRPPSPPPPAPDDPAWDLDAPPDLSDVPRLVYEGVGGGGEQDGGRAPAPSPTQPSTSALPFLARGDAVSAAAAAPRLAVVGTAGGRLHILDAGGHEVRSARPHTGAVAAVALDGGGEVVASVSGSAGGSSKGSLVLTPLDCSNGGSDLVLALPAPGTAVALDPAGGGGATSGGLLATPVLASAPPSPASTAWWGGVAVGLADGRVLTVSRGWLGRPGLAPLVEAGPGVPAAGEGAVLAAAWSGDAAAPGPPPSGRLLAWATGSAVYVADVRARRLVARVAWWGGRHAPPADASPPRLAWNYRRRHARPAVRELTVAWGASVRVYALDGGGGGGPQPALAFAAELGGDAAAAGAAHLPGGEDGGGADALVVLAVLPDGRTEARVLPREGGGGPAAATALPFPAVATPAAAVFCAAPPARPPPPAAARRPPAPAAPAHQPSSPVASSVAGGSVWEWGSAVTGRGSAAAARSRRPSLPRPPPPDDDPVFLLCAGRAGLIARPLAGDAMVSYLISAGRLGDAVAAARLGGSGAAVRAAAAAAWLEGALGAGAATAAAAAAPRLLSRGDARAWERAVHAFAAAGALPALAPYVPTMTTAAKPAPAKKERRGADGAPPPPPPPEAAPLLLRPATYTMVLHSLLLHPRDHATFLALVRSWPPGAVDAAALAPAAAARARAPGGASPPLVAAAADLHAAAGDPAAALGVLLRARSPDAPAFAAAHGLFSAVVEGTNVADLLACDRPGALAFLTTHWRACPPTRVVGALDAAAEAAAGAGDTAAAADARRAQWEFLDALFWAGHASAPSPDDPPSPATDRGLATRLVELTADYGRPGALASLLAACAPYDLAAADALLKGRGGGRGGALDGEAAVDPDVARARVVVLGRMGAEAEAVRVLVCDLGDVAGAAAFIAQRDAAAAAAAAAAGGASPPPRSAHLWTDLVHLAVSAAAEDGGSAVGALLDAAAGGGGVPVAALVASLPPSLPVPRLAPRLAAAARDARARAGLATAAAAVVARDGAGLGNRLYRAARAAVPASVVGVEEEGGGEGGGGRSKGTGTAAVWVGWDGAAAAPSTPAARGSRGRRAARGGPAPLIGRRT